jgi:hypothetical protein
MGYSTDFEGHFEITPALEPAQVEYLQQLADTRRMKRNALKLIGRPDPAREAVGLPLGADGEYYVGSSKPIPDYKGPSWDNHAGQQHTEDVVDYNKAPGGQPGLWLQWVPSTDGTALAWDGGEKFYAYVEWLKYLIERFFKPWGRVLNGEVEWIGEDSSDRGIIIVKNNAVTVKHGRIVYE